MRIEPMLLKEIYSTPELSTYGTVKDLTCGGGANVNPQDQTSNVDTAG